MSPENSAHEHPLVSVICRSIGRPQLQQALHSISTQTYPHLEIVLIDAAGKGLGDVAKHCGDAALVLVADGKQYRRSQAANIGLDTAHGEYLLFLDDDDWIASTHIESLVTCLQQRADIYAAFSNTQKTDHTGTPVDFVFNQDYDPILLMRDNYIPIHAMLFNRILLDKQCRFDEAFDIYEDWDFWLQLNQHTEFAHVDDTTAFYREGGESETANANTEERYLTETLLGKGRAALFDKWLPRWNGALLNQLIGSLDKSHQLQQLADEIHALRVQLDGATHQQNLLQGELEQARALLANKDQQIADLQQHAANQEQHIAAISQTLNQIYQSPSWQLMGPFRRLYRFLAAASDTKPRKD